MVILDRCVGGCNTFNDLYNNVYVPNKPEDLNLNIFSMILGKNKSKTVTEQISSQCKYKLDSRKCNSN